MVRSIVSLKKVVWPSAKQKWQPPECLLENCICRSQLPEQVVTGGSIPGTAQADEHGRPRRGRIVDPPVLQRGPPERVGIGGSSRPREVGPLRLEMGLVGRCREPRADRPAARVR